MRGRGNFDVAGREVKKKAGNTRERGGNRCGTMWMSMYRLVMAPDAARRFKSGGGPPVDLTCANGETDDQQDNQTGKR